MADDMVKNAIRRTKCFWYLPQIIWFNFHYLPFKQAIKLPILLYKPKLLRCKGTLTLNGAISFGIIKLGFYTVPNYPNNGIIWNVRGNVIIEDFCIIGNDSLIDVGEKGTLTLGKHFVSSAALKINCYNSISFGSNNMIGFDNHFIDTNIHTYKIVKRGREFKAKGYAPIVIGSYNWFGFGITTIAGTT
ncbi:MAG: hypothetical protein LBO06_05725, partial [Bacteroidales bacterium]|nr:hypothetical protein [Bacteroidales bacterium]